MVDESAPIATSTDKGALPPFIPPWLKGKKNAPKFSIRSGSVIERGQLEAELAGEYRAGRVQLYELIESIRLGLLKLLADDPDLDHILSLIDVEAAGEMDTLAEVDKQTLANVRKILAEHWPPYRDLLAQSERRREIAPIVALRRFCTGIEAEGVTFALDSYGLVSESTLTALDPIVMQWAGTQAFAVQYGAGGQEKNSPPPSKSGDSPKRSPSAGASKAAGPLAKKTNGKKIRASRSRRGSGPSSTSGSSADATPTP